MIKMINKHANLIAKVINKKYLYISQIRPAKFNIICFPCKVSNQAYLI